MKSVLSQVLTDCTNDTLAACIRQMLKSRWTLKNEPLPEDCFDILVEAAERLEAM